MNIVIFGTGLYYQRRKHYFNDIEVIGFLDNDTNKHGSEFDGKKIYAPEEILNMSFDYIFIMSNYKIEMKKQLIELGVRQEYILDMYQINKIITKAETKIYYNVKPSDKLEEVKKNILLVSSELSYTGAPIVLFYVAKILQNNGYYPIIVSTKDGDLRAKMVNEGMTVIIDKFISIHNYVLELLINKSVMILFNSLSMEYVINDFKVYNSKIMWWLHEGESIYQGGNCKYIDIDENIPVYADSDMAVKAYRNHSLNGIVEKLAFGIPDKFKSNKFIMRNSSSKIIFAIIGYISIIKAQDIFADAIAKLSEEYLNKAEFWIIGKVLEPKIQLYIEEKLSEKKMVKFLGEKSIEELDELYKQIDVVVCPSREDMGPVVIAEGMMLKKVCIASDMTGNSKYIIEKENGLICTAGKSEPLAEKIKWVIDNQDKVQMIGENARKVYETKFSMEVFEKNLLNVINKVIKNI